MVDEKALIKAMETAWCITEEQCHFVKKIIEAYLEHARSAGTPSEPDYGILPYDVKIGATMFRAGVSLKTFIEAATRWHDAGKAAFLRKVGMPSDVRSIDRSKLHVLLQKYFRQCDINYAIDSGLAEAIAALTAQGDDRTAPPIPRDNIATGNGDSIGCAGSGRTEPRADAGLHLTNTTTIKPGQRPIDRSIKKDGAPK